MKRVQFLGGAAAALLAFAASFGAPAAQAAPPTIYLDSPTDAAPHAETNVHIAGRAQMPSGGTVHGQLYLALESRDGRPTQSVTVNVNGNPVPFAWDVPAAYNGNYTVKVVAHGRDGAFDTSPNEPAVYTRNITVEVLPVPPANVRVETDAKRQVTVRWDPNPEPDLLGYQVQRRLGEPPSNEDPEAGWASAGETTSTELTDTATTAAGGTYHYRVRAVRSGATQGTGVWSHPSEVNSVDVANPPPTTSTTSRNGGNGGSGGTGNGGSGGSGSPLAQTGKVDLSGFSALLNNARVPSPGQGRPAEDDGTYNETLPFKPGEEGELGEDGTGLALGVEEAGESDAPEPIAFVAASLLVTVIVMHLLWLKREVDKVPEGALEPTEA